MDSKLYNKTGIIIRELSLLMLVKEDGDRIESISTYAHKFEVANGTVQNAFKYLKDKKAIKTQSKGHLGTYVYDINVKELINISGHRDIIGVMPLPYSRLYQAFATALYLDAQSTSIDLQLAFMRGAQARIKMLINGKYDFVTMSKLSAKHYLNKHDELDIIINFGKHTYLSEHSMVFLNTKNNTVKDGMRVGIDYNSKDMEIITKHQCRNNQVVYVALPYIQLINKIKTKEIDMAIMNSDDIKDRKEKLNLVSIDNDYFNYSDTETVLIISKNNKFAKSIINKTLDKERILKTMNNVIAGKIAPIY